MIFDKWGGEYLAELEGRFPRSSSLLRGSGTATIGA
jgi:hypothetical protein